MARNNITQAQLGRRLGISQSAVGHALARARRGGRLPARWATRIEHITDGKVRVADEWPHEACRRDAA